jgi:hypothetical protein
MTKPRQCLHSCQLRDPTGSDCFYSKLPVVYGNMIMRPSFLGEDFRSGQELPRPARGIN